MAIYMKLHACVGITGNINNFLNEIPRKTQNSKSEQKILLTQVNKNCVSNWRTGREYQKIAE